MNTSDGFPGTLLAEACRVNPECRIFIVSFKEEQ
jgi:hypothetical protein